MAWLSRSLGDSVSSLTGQLSSLTKDILTEGTEEVSDHATELSLAKERIQQLESLYATQKAENDRLKRVNRELEEKAESSELQINSISREYRVLLEEKEKEINSLKQRHHELLEQHAKSALHSPGESAPAVLPVHGSDQSQGFENEDFESWSSEGWGDFDDSLRLQREINHLRQEVTRLRADSQHWRSVAGQLSGDKGGDHSAHDEILSLKARIKELEKQATESREHAQHEVASLQDVHQNKMAALKKRHKEEVTQLKAQLSTLEQQLADVRDTDSTSTVHSTSVLPESDRTEAEGSVSSPQALVSSLQQQLAAVTQDKEKVSTAKSHLEGVLQELQTEVETLQSQREEHVMRIAELDTALRKQSQQHADEITALRQQLEDLEEERSQVVQTQQQVGLDLIHAKQCLLDQLDANHADTRDILSDLRSVRQQLHTETAERQERLLMEKQAMAMKLYAAGVKESKLKSSIAEAGSELQQVSSETESLVDKLGSPEQQRLAADVLDNLEKENLMLKEQSAKLQEQITVLEKRVASHQADWHNSQQTVRQLRRQLKQLKGDTGSDTDNTLDESFASEHVDSTSIASPPPTSTSPDDDAAAEWQIEKEALEDVLAQLRQELREKDERLSHLSNTSDVNALEQELTSLRRERESLQAEVSSLTEREKSLINERDSLQAEMSSLTEREQSLMAERDELETSLGELDEQHQEATNHLISARNALQAQLADAQQQVKDLQEELQNLSQQQSVTEPGVASESPEGLREELRKLQEDLAASRQLAESRDSEIAELKGKLQKGSLAINDLHMDKRELEGEVGRLKEEVRAKVGQIKALREEKERLVEDNRDLTERLQELEDELESWQQRNEDAQMQRQQLSQEVAEDRDDMARLHKELAHLQSDYATVQESLDSLTAQCEELHAANARLREERDGLQSANASLQHEKDSLKAELDQVIQKAVSLHQVADLEKLMSGLSLASQESEMDTSQTVRELESQVKTFKQQLDMLVKEKAELLQSGARPQDEAGGIEAANHSQPDVSEGSISELLAQNRQLITVLHKRCRALDRISASCEQHRCEADIQQLADTEQGEMLMNLLGPNISDMKTDTEHLLETVQQETATLERLDQQGGSSENNQLPRWYGPSQELAVLRADKELLSLMVGDKDTVIAGLQDSLSTLQQEKASLDEAAAEATERLQTYESSVAEKDNELESVQAENERLAGLCEDYKVRLAEAESQVNTLKSQLTQAQANLQQMKVELETSQQSLQAQSEEESIRNSTLVTQLQKELEAARDMIGRLEADLQEKEETLSCHQAGIEALNTRCEEQSKELENTQAQASQQQNVIAFLRQNSVSVEQELERAKVRLHKAMSFLTPEQCLVVQEVDENTPVSPTSSLPALEFPDKPALPMPMDDHSSNTEGSSANQDDIMKNGFIVEMPDDSPEKDQYSDKAIRLAEQIDELQRQLEEKEEIIADLQQNNATLLQMLEAQQKASASPAGSSPKDSSLLEIHRLESEVKALKVEKEQMLAVMNEKSREASSLKAEVMRLMNVVSAEKSALEKLQQDNQALMSRPRKDDSMDDMQREALQNLSRLVRDREMEIEALKQKNETLMTILQDSNQAGGGAPGSAGSLHSHFADKENLERQLATLQSEREQMVAFVNQKHAESVAYHAEIQRLNAVRAEEGEKMDRLQADYDKLCSQFEDRNQSLLKAQNDLINYKQRFSDMEVKYGELLQRSNASETVDAASFRTVQDEKDRLSNKLAELQKTLQERDEKIRTLTEKVMELENAVQSRDSENASLRKQVEHLGFQLQGLGSETEDLRKDRESAEQKMQKRESETHLMKDLNNQLTLSLREKEFEVASLQERLQKVTALLSEQQGEKTQVTQLLRDQEAAAEKTARLQQEVGQMTLRLKQKQQELSDMETENLRLKDKEHKLNRELERLRSHLLQIEEGYTREALEAEEREKNLRNRLADAEERLLSSTSQIQSASQQASQQVESLQQQLQTIAGQRDSAYMQMANLQEQCQQYASSLSNLQLVLEQFQRERESQIAAETERYQQEAERLKVWNRQLEKELQQTKAELDEATDGLAAASRLSEQLDRKEEAIQALREEVQQREKALRAAEEHIHKLTSSTEAKVDRELMKNLLLGYFHTPARNRKDAIHAIGSVLGFTHDDFSKIEEGDGGDSWYSSLLGRARRGSSPPSTPVRQMRTPEFNQSFSQLFVKFLEKESTPPPAPVRLPAEEMAREAQQRHHVRERDPHDKPAFNPFTAPRHVSMPISVGSAASTPLSTSSHLLMAAPGSPTTTFPVFSPFALSQQDGQAGGGGRGGGDGAGGGRSTPQTSSTILKDVLGSR